jgi:hypothetical protein
VTPASLNALSAACRVTHVCLSIGHRYALILLCRTLQLTYFIQYWTSSFWEKASLFKLSASFAFQLGHANGTCPLLHAAQDITILHINGIHDVHVHFCNCAQDYSTHKRVQLLRQRLYPATVLYPRTCATFEVLELYHKLFLSSGLSVYAFVSTLESLTDCAMLTSVPVSVCPT